MNRYRPAPHIIRRRRIALLVVLALLVWGIWAGVSAVIGLFTGGSKTATVSACEAGVVSVTAYAGDGEKHQDTFPNGVKPYIWFTLVNNGKVACKFNAGPAVQFFRIKTGDQVIWTSEQCDRTGLKDAEVVLQPGKPQSSPPGQWFRVYSSGGGCGEGQAPAFVGTYTLTAEVNKVVSSNVETFELQ
ncbi:MAG: hypothetical protein RL166_917 [Actinomycetota bacterium]|jgi:hypothetical protein